MGEREIRAFLSDLAINHHCSSTRNQAFSAILFLYRNVLHRELKDLKTAERPLRAAHLHG